MPEPRLRAATKETKGKVDEEEEEEEEDVKGMPSVAEKAAGSVRP